MRIAVVVKTHGAVLFGEEHAERLEIHAMFDKVLDFPVCRFGSALVVIAEHRLDIVKRRNARPAHMLAVLPQRANI